MKRFALFAALFLLIVSSNGGSEVWKFAVFGDNRGNPKDGLNEEGTAYLDGGINRVVLTAIAKQIKRERVDFAVNIGDLGSKWHKKVEGWSENLSAADLISEELDCWLKIWHKHSGHTRLYPVRGNHEATPRLEEDKDGLVEAWKSHFPGLPYGTGPLGEDGLTYFFQHKNALFVCIDQYEETQDPSVPKVNNEWLKDVLERVRKRHVFVIGHTPAFPSVDEALPDLQKALPTPDGVIDPVAVSMRDRFWDILGRNGARLYFCGHQHMYARAVAKAHARLWPRQIIVGAGGAPLDPLPELLYIDNYDISCSDGNGCTYEELKFPRVLPETQDLDNGQFGYMVVEIEGSLAICT